MPAPIETALSTLLPTLSFLPPDLIAHAHSLLSQSRSRAANLKPDEEIARSYACAHLACDRLKKRLDLDVAKPAPPVKPSVYERLYKYLDSALVGRSRRDGRDGPSGRETGRGAAVSGSVGATPGKKTLGVGHRAGEAQTQAQTALQTPSGTATGSKRKRGAEQPEEVPPFAMPLIRAICRTLELPAAAPHVLVGATAAVREIVSRAVVVEDPPSRKRRRTPQSAQRTAAAAAVQEEIPATGIAHAKWPALLVALACVTAGKMKGIAAGDDEEMKELREMGISAARKFCQEKQASLPEGVDARLNSLEKDVAFEMLEAEDCGWLDMEWFQTVPEQPHAGPEDDEDVNDSEVEEHAAKQLTPRKERPDKTPLHRREKHGGKAAGPPLDGIGPGAAGLLPGLGTMFQPAVDWLSDERRDQYKQWKRGIMREIAAIEQEA